MLDFANTKQLDSRITYTRASTASYYDGVTTSKAEENLVTYSQEFDNAAWATQNSTITANSTTAPDGTTTAETVTEAATTNVHNLRRFNYAVQSSTTYTASVYVKPNGRSIVYIDLTHPGVANYRTWFDISAGTVLTSAGGNTGTITSAGSGWFRIAVSRATASNQTNQTFEFGPTTADNTSSYLGDGTSGIFIWGAQLEIRSSVTAYTATTTQAITNYIPKLQSAASGVARFDNNPTTGESLGLLIEESRTNLLTYSSDYTNAVWTKTNTTITSAANVAPDGTQTAQKVVESTSSSGHELYEAVTLVSGNSYTWSGYFKAAGRNWVAFLAQDASGNTTYFDLQNGVVGTNASGNTASITSVGNGWYRCTLTRTVSGTSGYWHILTASANNTVTYTGDGFSGYFVWGAQVELGAFATSYIPTVASQVTRAADAASMTGTNFSTWYNQAEGTMYAEAGKPLSNFTSTRIIAEIGDGTIANRLNFNVQTTTTTGLFAITTNSVAVASITVSGVFASGYGKLAGGYVVDNAQLAGNGTLGTADTSCQIPVVNRMTIGDINAGGLIWNGTIKKIAYYPLRVTNAQLQSLTS